MCGIVGVYSDQMGKPEHDLFRKLLLLSVFRGEHSTGVVKVGSKKVRTQRSALSSPEYLSTKHASGFLNSDNVGVQGFIGHTRHATKGNINVQNAHPFSFDRIVGVHNGTIHSKFDHSDEYDTDSEALYRNINDYGLEEAIKKVNLTNSAYALVWVDKQEKTLNFMRNSKRPLHFSYLYSKRTLIWASEKEMLEYAVRKAGNLTMTGWKKNDGTTTGTTFTLSPHDILTIPIGESPAQAVLTPIGFDEAKPTHTVHYAGGYTTYRGGQFSGNGQGTSGTTQTTTSRGTNSGNHQANQAWIKGSDGQYRSKADEERRLAALKKSETDYKGHRKEGVDLAGIPWMRETDNDTDTNNTDSQLWEDLHEHGLLGDEDQEFFIPDSSSPHAPRTEHELDYKLASGCCGCGTVVDKRDPDIDGLRWWDRDFYFCADCVENSDGDWVRHCLEDDWESLANLGANGQRMVN